MDIYYYHYIHIIIIQFSFFSPLGTRTVGFHWQARRMVRLQPRHWRMRWFVWREMLTGKLTVFEISALPDEVRLHGRPRCSQHQQHQVRPPALPWRSPGLCQKLSKLRWPPSHWRTGPANCRADEAATVRLGIKMMKFFFIFRSSDVEWRMWSMMTAPPLGESDTHFRVWKLLTYNFWFVWQWNGMCRGSRWRVANITYKISKYPRLAKMTKQDIDSEIRKAWQVWSSVTDLSFEQRRSGKVHVDIRFEDGEHGDGDNFDGLGGTLAHAFFPVYGGDVHFDNSEHWTMRSLSGTNLAQTAV